MQLSLGICRSRKKPLFFYNSWMFSFIEFLLLPLRGSHSSCFLNYSNCMKRKTWNVLRVPHAPDTDTLFCCTVCFFSKKKHADLKKLITTTTDLILCIGNNVFSDISENKLWTNAGIASIIGKIGCILVNKTEWFPGSAVRALTKPPKI